MYDVRGRRAVVTGGSRGLGLEFTRRLLCAGVSGVVISDVDINEGTKAVAKLRAEFGEKRYELNIKLHFSASKPIFPNHILILSMLKGILLSSGLIL